VSEVTVDRKLRIVSTPAHGLGPRIGDVAEGMAKARTEAVRLARPPAVAR
jgi:enhancing lycopene biosynthesis protein 2